MTLRRYTLITPEKVHAHAWSLHKVGCQDIPKELRANGGTKEMIKLDLDDDDEAVMREIDIDDLGYTIDDVRIFSCTGYEEETFTVADAEAAEEHAEASRATPPSSHPAAKASREAAVKRLQEQVEEVIDKLVIKRGTDNIGESDKWSELRLKTCTDDYVYDLAVEVRKLRERGEAWWRVAYELGLPGSGASNKQGRKGSAFARRVWRAAWGKTYLGDRGQRESKLTREARALADQARPYFAEDAQETEIINRVCGQLIHWVAKLPGEHGLITSAQEAYVHHDPHMIKLRIGPKGRYLEFYEQVDAAQLCVDPRLSIAKSGPLRAVYVNRITRVGI
jgi:hypothetical protein